MIPAELKRKILALDPSLTKIDLSGLRITDDELAEILPALQRNPHILELNLANNYLNNKSARRLAEILKANTNLLNLNLANNLFTRQCLVDFQIALKENRTLHQLSLPSHLLIAESEILAIQNALACNMTLNFLMQSYQKAWSACQRMLAACDGQTEDFSEEEVIDIVVKYNSRFEELVAQLKLYAINYDHKQKNQQLLQAVFNDYLMFIKTFGQNYPLPALQVALPNCQELPKLFPLLIPICNNLYQQTKMVHDKDITSNRVVMLMLALVKLTPREHVLEYAQSFSTIDAGLAQEAYQWVSTASTQQVVILRNSKALLDGMISASVGSNKLSETLLSRMRLLIRTENEIYLLEKIMQKPDPRLKELHEMRALFIDEVYRQNEVQNYIRQNKVIVSGHTFQLLTQMLTILPPFDPCVVVDQFLDLVNADAKPDENTLPSQSPVSADNSKPKHKMAYATDENPYLHFNGTVNTAIRAQSTQSVQTVTCPSL